MGGEAVRTPEQLIADTAPFPDKLVQKLPPRGDSYVPWYEYAQRLLLHHPDYSWTVTTIVAGANGWAVAGDLRLEKDGPCYSGTGEDAESVASAESQAYKRACAKAGIGLHLYDEDGYWLHGRLVKGNDDVES